ncbi:hypothetical protein NT6N_05960 [Oceaniferula spumae]|uniref:Uncharacterized protein n=1 Tax=Oceaniferula spumae TaxID=2979115 RepID=A0AAT9FHT0_9BACT
MKSLESTLNLAFTFGLSCQGFLDSCQGDEFSALETALRMKANVVLTDSKKLQQGG